MHSHDLSAVEGPAAVPVGGGRAWPGFEPTRRAKLAGGPPPTGTRSGRARWCPERQWHHTAMPETMRGLVAAHVGGSDTCLRQISHVI